MKPWAQKQLAILTTAKAKRSNRLALQFEKECNAGIRTVKSSIKKAAARGRTEFYVDRAFSKSVEQAIGNALGVKLKPQGTDCCPVYKFWYRFEFSQ
jgi:hypothetical protein